jgi:hypothetical protein
MLEREAFTATYRQAAGTPLPHVAASIPVLRYGPWGEPGM